jgi:trigger factor
MKVKIKDTGECAALFEIEVPKETVDRAFEEVYDEITKFAKIPGFREGKAPKDLVRKRYAAHAKEEVLKRLVPSAYKDALLKHNIAPLGAPQISDLSLGEGEALLFKAKVDRRPEFKLKNYLKVRIESRKAVVKEDDVEKMLENLRQLNARYTAVEDRDIQLGDYVVGDLECSVDGKAIHKKRENIYLHVDKEAFPPGLAGGMPGMKKGEERDVASRLPENYPDKKLAGKPAIYHVKVREIKSRTVPELNDELAKELGSENLDELKKRVRSELESSARFNAMVDMENKLLDFLADNNVFNVPQRLVARQLALMVEDAKRRLEEKGFTRGDLDKKDAEFAEKFKDDAVRRVRLMFILDRIGEEENISATDDDLEEAYRSISARTGQGIEKIKDYYHKEDLVENLKEKIRNEKTIKFLLAKADIVEKDI